MPRKNKTKDEIKEDLKRVEKVKREKALVKLMFPFIENAKTIYDAQTALLAVSGYIKAELANKTAEIKVYDLKIDLTKEPDSDVKSMMLSLLGQVEPENAEEVADLLERFGDILPKIGANEYLKNPMNTIKLTDIVAE